MTSPFPSRRSWTRARVEFHPTAVDLFDQLSEEDQDRADEAIDKISLSPTEGEHWEGGPLREWKAEGLWLLYLSADNDLLVVIAWIELQ